MRYVAIFIAILSGCMLLFPGTIAGILVIDPGHGGPGADMFNNGGGYNQNRGAIGPVEGIAEQWVNLNVAMELAEILGPSNYVLTRHNDTENVSLQVRAQIANASGDLLISIHHNGLPLGMQATEMRWCGDSLNSNGLPRQNDFSDSTFAKKALYKLLDAFGYDDRCRILHQGDPIGMGCQDCDGDPWLIKIVSKDNSRSGALCS